MKILIVGSGLYKIYEHSLKNGFEHFGVKVDTFYFKDYFQGNNWISDIYNRFQNKYLIGPNILLINLFLIKRIIKSKYDFALIYRGIHIYPLTTLILSKYTVVYGYNNDDPFGTSMKSFYWRFFLKSVKFYTHVFSYRPSNIQQYFSIGAKSVSLLLSSYDKERNYKMNFVPSNRYACDVLFIGHFENDGRDEAILSLIDCGYNVKIYGDLNSWKQSSLYYILNNNNKIELIVDDYNLAINSSKMALNFLSKDNNDVYTRRCFEIPITGTVLISEYSSFLGEIFEENNEIVMFKDVDELKNKVEYLINNPNELNRIGKNGMKKVEEVHSNFSRSLQILMSHESLK